MQNQVKKSPAQWARFNETSKQRKFATRRIAVVQATKRK